MAARAVLIRTGADSKPEGGGWNLSVAGVLGLGRYRAACLGALRSARRGSRSFDSRVQVTAGSECSATSEGSDLTPDGRYVVIDGRKWRATDPSLPEERRNELVAELMSARSSVLRTLSHSS